MPDISLTQIHRDDARSMRQVRDLLAEQGLLLDANLDYTCALVDDDLNLIATGSCFGNTLRCLAVRADHQGEGLLNQILTHLTEYQLSRGYRDLFLYTKVDSARFFKDLGFYEIARVENRLVFMENRRNGFSNYLDHLERGPEQAASAAALVVNANPFTFGHQYLVERATSENDVLHLFIVSEDQSLVPFPIRKRLVREGCAHLSNIVFHDSGPYLISSATFPSYFLKDEASIMEAQALLDLTLFKSIASVLSIKRRYVGEEPFSQVTNIYNRVMSDELPKAGIDCVTVPRKLYNGTAISASTVRKAIQENDLERLKTLVPETTYRFFQSDEAIPIIEKIRSTENVIHH